MKKGLLILLVGIVISLSLAGCNSEKKDSNGKTADKYTMDFDKDGSKETFYLTKKGKGKEADFELWYKKENSKKLIEKSTALNDGTKLFLYEADKNYVVLNFAQSTLGKDAKVYVYYVNNGKCQIADNISGAQIIKKKDDLFVLKGSYCQFDNELQAWNATSEQEYHVTIAGGKIVDYKSKELSQKEFEKYNNAKEVWSDIEKQINKEYGEKSTNAVKYIDRDDGTIDVNVVTTLPNGDKIKNYVTLTKNGSDLNRVESLKDGNKKLSFNGNSFNDILPEELETFSKERSLNSIKDENIKNVMLNKTKYYNTATKKMEYVKDFKYTSFMNVDKNGKCNYYESGSDDPMKLKITSWCEVDIDKDQKQEVVLMCKDGTEIVFNSEERVCGYVFPFRGLKGLKKNGLSASSGSAAETYIGTLKFDNENCFFEYTGISDGYEKRYELNGKKVSKKEANKYINAFYDRQDDEVTWYEW